MSVLGIGPLLVIVGAVTTMAIIVFEKLLRFTLPLPSPLREWGFFVGIALLIVGVFFWISGAVHVRRAFGSHQLVTSGVYNLSRNPMYAAFIVFIVPGIALILNDITLILISVTMFVAFKALIGREEEYLVTEFGDEYERYRKSVAQLIPFIHL